MYCRYSIITPGMFSNPEQIADSFRRFGISDQSTSILAIKVGGDASQIEAHLTEHVQGTPVPFTDATLQTMCDPARIRKIYRVDVASNGKVAVSKEAEAFVLGTMALKGS